MTSDKPTPHARSVSPCSARADSPAPGDEPARLDLGDHARRHQSRDVLAHAPALDRLEEAHGVPRAIDEAVDGDLVERVRLTEEFEQPALAIGDDAGVARELLEE